MAKRTPFTAQEERLQRLVRNAELKIVALKGMIDTARSIVEAQYVKVDDAVSPQVLRVSEGGTLEAGGDSPMKTLPPIVEAVSHTGDTLETTLGTITVPANSMGPNGFVRITTVWKIASAGKVNIYFGQINAANKVGYWSLPLPVLLEARPVHVWNTNDASAQSASSAADTLALSIHYDAGASPVSMTEDTTSDIEIYFTVQNNLAGDTSYLYYALAEAFYGE
jgi:hypothetical protein